MRIFLDVKESPLNSCDTGIRRTLSVCLVKRGRESEAAKIARKSWTPSTIDTDHVARPSHAQRLEGSSVLLAVWTGDGALAARKLVIALWRYVETGKIPTRAIITA